MELHHERVALWQTAIRGTSFQNRRFCAARMNGVEPFQVTAMNAWHVAPTAIHAIPLQGAL